ncbi:uncharacterized protein LY89DRAFT_730657 [Mollisia scopiformis]|uniref:Uncharacterized protein n=1 Tax=Mollisia scopiformis TaxID=149040 RepID=A0A194XKF8_MOLSC|nr:uncharacterized protein LY89DRAFT_730657 [Mollisia scopiformis]KUJ20626.1 hypothetical protein LY89DRAFT_730657 [Mollisia scopiformis]
MKTQQYLTIVTLFSSFANSFPQSRRSNTELATPPEVAVLARTITIGDTTTTIGGFTVGNPGDGGSPVTTFSGAMGNFRLPEQTDAPVSTSTQSGPAHRTTPSNEPVPTNPWNAVCPVPSMFTINNFVFVSGKGGDVSFTVTYGNGTISCPTQGQEVFSLGFYDMSCNNGSVHAQTDGSSWILVQERYTCPGATGSGSNSAALTAWTNYTTFGESLFCDTDDAAVQTCLQLNPNIEFPVLNYETAGSITSK